MRQRSAAEAQKISVAGGWTAWITRLVHGGLWIVISLAALLFLGLCAAAYGLRGSWVQGWLDDCVPAEVGRLSFGRLSYLPSRGVTIEALALHDKAGKLLVGCSRAEVGLRIFCWGGWNKRLKRVTVWDLFVAQLEHDPNRQPERTPLSPELRRPLPDFAAFPIPDLPELPLRLIRPDVLEIRLDEVAGALVMDSATHRVTFRNLHGRIDQDGQWAEAEVLLDFLDASAKATIRGFIYQQRLNGIYRALNFPIIQAYSDLFTLRQPAWGDCSFTVGFDKYRNLFNLRVDIAARAGDYCGVPFDEAETTIRCRGIWDAVTTIEPIIARRDGKIVAQGSLRFDCPADTFTFSAHGTGLQPRECFDLVHEPFTELIPEVIGTQPPEVVITGSLPLLSKQTPGKIRLDGRFRFDQGCEAFGVPFKRLSSEVRMDKGRLSFQNLCAELGEVGKVTGHTSLIIPESAEYADLDLALLLEKVPLNDLLMAAGRVSEKPVYSQVDGALTLGCRLDETLRKSLSARFNLSIDGGLITRLPLFSGLTNLLADYIPGVSSLTDTSHVKLAGTADAGLFTIPDFSLTGDLLAIEGDIFYNLPQDQLFAEVMAGNFKRGSVMGTLTRWVTLPVNRFLWKIRVTGPISAPQWHIVTFVGNLWEKVKGED
ncbi:MAG: hypothetical protein ACI4RT_01330 [Candidatus Spyradenecus sp.]